MPLCIHYISPPKIHAYILYIVLRSSTHMTCDKSHTHIVMFSNSAHTDSTVDSAECFFVVDLLRWMCSDSIRSDSFRSDSFRSYSNSFRSLRSDRMNQSSESQPELIYCGDIHHHQRFEPRMICFLQHFSFFLSCLESRQFVLD